jgi:hypothetical protein
MSEMTNNLYLKKLTTFYLDSHCSLGNTFLGDQSTPISLELSAISHFWIILRMFL